MKSNFLILSILTLFFISCTVDEKYNNDLKTSTSSSINLGSNSTEESTDMALKCGGQYRNSSTKISLNVQTRGFYSSVKIEGSLVSKNSSGVVPPSQSIISNDKLNTINYLFSRLNLVQLPNYLAPSTSHQFDGVPSEVLTIEHNGVKYVSKTYDAGNPPVQIKAFVNYIKSL
ncbi:MAG: hypothetical protein QM535_02625 [Limnohabitans sp.]|nr:hypothetical protein [Limnohabitans sp.]